VALAVAAVAAARRAVTRRCDRESSIEFHIAREVGAGVPDVARELISTYAAWTRSTEDDPRIDAWCALRRSNQMSASEWAERRSQWFSDQSSVGGDDASFERWLRSHVPGRRLATTFVSVGHADPSGLPSSRRTRARAGTSTPGPGKHVLAAASGCTPKSQTRVSSIACARRSRTANTKRS
jgi:hypothetical protein